MSNSRQFIAHLQDLCLSTNQSHPFPMHLPPFSSHPRASMAKKQTAVTVTLPTAWKTNVTPKLKESLGNLPKNMELLKKTYWTWPKLITVSWPNGVTWFRPPVLSECFLTWAPRSSFHGPCVNLWQVLWPDFHNYHPWRHSLWILRIFSNCLEKLINLPRIKGFLQIPDSLCHTQKNTTWIRPSSIHD